VSEVLSVNTASPNHARAVDPRVRRPQEARTSADLPDGRPLRHVWDRSTHPRSFRRWVAPGAVRSYVCHDLKGHTGVVGTPSEVEPGRSTGGQYEGKSPWGDRRLYLEDMPAGGSRWSCKVGRIGKERGRAGNLILVGAARLARRGLLHISAQGQQVVGGGDDGEQQEKQTAESNRHAPRRRLPPAKPPEVEPR
jgi:hypothetical protein